MPTNQPYISPELKEQVLKLGDNDSDFIKEFVSIFIRNTSTCLVELKMYSAKNDRSGLYQIAHKLKSNFNLLNQVEAKQICSNIEQSNDLEEMKASVPRLEEIIPELNAQLAYFLS